MIHPARTMPFKELAGVMAEAVAAKLVNEHVGDNGLRLYCYTRAAVYDRQWTPASMMARGLILDHTAEHVVATPFPKFFNVGEATQTIPDLPFETFEKVDGSLIIIFWHDGAWRTATKGSLRSSQAQWAAAQLASVDLSNLSKGTTYLAEAIYPENRIVVRYEERGLVLLAAYNEAGNECAYVELQAVGDRLGWRTAKRFSYESVSDLIARAGLLPANEEGFVLRFTNGLRLKVKGDEYRRIHALISRCTPLAMWEAMMAGDDMSVVRRDLPEEFWADFDGITSALSGRLDTLTGRIAATAALVAGKTDKELGLTLDAIDPDVRPFIFSWRKFGGQLQGKSKESLYRAIRPTGNVLPGYVPSYAMSRVMDEASA